MKKLLIITSLFVASPVIACPFCEVGARDTAFFIISVFGLFALSGVLLLLYFWKKNYFDSANDLADRVLEAEGLTDSSRSNHESRK